MVLLRIEPGVVTDLPSVARMEMRCLLRPDRVRGNLNALEALILPFRRMGQT